MWTELVPHIIKDSPSDSRIKVSNERRKIRNKYGFGGGR
jgi:hypothetical protein